MERKITVIGILMAWAENAERQYQKEVSALLIAVRVRPQAAVRCRAANMEIHVPWECGWRDYLQDPPLERVNVISVPKARLAGGRATFLSFSYPLRRIEMRLELQLLRLLR